jgi:poly(3-hydroxybutyrate) depolymerase
VRNTQGKLERVKPQDIATSALLTVEGELDDISGSGQTAAAHGLCSGIPKERQQHLEVEGAGHYGIFSGRRWREVVYPRVKQFILANTPKPAEAAVPPAVVAAESSETTPPMVAKSSAKARKN